MKAEQQGTRTKGDDLIKASEEEDDLCMNREKKKKTFIREEKVYQHQKLI